MFGTLCTQPEGQALFLSDTLTSTVFPYLSPSLPLPPAQHYAAKTIENMCGLQGVLGQRLATPAAVSELSRLAHDPATGSALRGTAASALARITHAAPALLPGMLEQGGVASCAQGLSDGSQRVQQAAATLLCQLLALPATSAEAVSTLLGGEAALAALATLLESPSEVLRGKAVVAAALVVRHGGARALAAISTSRLMHQVGRRRQRGDE